MRVDAAGVAAAAGVVAGACCAAARALRGGRRRSRRRRQRQVGQQPEPDAGQLHGAGGHCALVLRLLQQEPGIRQLELRRQTLAVAELGDPVGPLRLLHDARRGLPGGARVGELEPGRGLVERRQLLRELETGAALDEIRARRQLVCLQPAAGEDRHGRGRADGPVGAELAPTRETRIGDAAERRAHADRRQALRPRDADSLFALLHVVAGLRHGGAGTRAFGAGFGGGDRRRPARGRRRQDRRLQRRHELQRLIERQIEQLLQTQVGEVALVAHANHLRPLGIARHLRAQQIELGHAPRLALLPHLVGGSLCLREGLFRDHDQAIGQHRVEIRLRDVERELRPRRGQRQRRVRTTEPRLCLLCLQAPARVDVLRECEIDSIRVRLPERQGKVVVCALATVAAAERVRGRRAVAQRALDLGDAVLERRLRVHQERNAGRAGRIEQAGELRRQRAIVGGHRRHLRQPFAADALLLALSPRHAGSGNRHLLALRLGQLQRLVQRQHARGRRRLPRRHGRTGFGYRVPTLHQLGAQGAGNRKQDDAHGEDTTRPTVRISIVHVRHCHCGLVLGACRAC